MNPLPKIKQLFKSLNINTNNNRAYYYYDIYEYFKNFKVNKPLKIVEFGDYSNNIIYKLISQTHITIYNHLEYPKYNLLKLDNVKEKYDIVIVDQIFEHLPDPFKATQQIYKILKPNGIVICSTVFLYPLHYTDPLAKKDYFRFSKDGLKQVFGDYIPVLVKMYGNKDYIKYLAKNNWFISKPYNTTNNLFTTKNKKFYQSLNEDYGVSVLGIFQKKNNIDTIKKFFVTCKSTNGL